MSNTNNNKPSLGSNKNLKKSLNETFILLILINLNYLMEIESLYFFKAKNLNSFQFYFYLRRTPRENIQLLSERIGKLGGVYK